MRKLKRSGEKYLSIFIAVSLVLIIAGFGGILTGFAVANQGSSIVFDQIITDTDGNAAIKIYNAISGGTVSGGNTASKDGPLHSDLNSSNFWSNGVDHSSLAGLWQGDVNIQVGDINKDYKTKEKITFEGASVETGLSLIAKSGATPSQNYKDIPFIIVGTGDIKYRYEFEESLASGNYISNATTTEPIWMTILGNRLRIEGTGGAADKLVTVSGQYCSLEVGQTCTAFGKSIKLSAGSGTSGKFEIDGKESEWIDSMKSYKFKDSGLDLYIEDMHTIGDTRQDFMAEVWVSDTKAKKIYSSGEAFVGEDENKPNWKWELGSLNTANPSINVTFAQNWDQPNEVVALGSTLPLPGGKATLELERLIREEFREYTIKYDVADIYLDSSSTTAFISSAKVFSIVSEGGTGDGISVNGHSTDTVAVYFAGGEYGLGLYYEDSSAGGNMVLAKNTSSNSSYQEITLSFGSTSLPVNLAAAVAGASGDNMNVSFEEDKSYAGDAYELVLYVESNAANQINYIGHSSSDSSTVKDWCYAVAPYASGCGGASDLDISSYRENVMTDAGLILVNPYNSAPSEQFTLRVNEDIGDFDVRVKLYGPEAYVAKGVVALKSNVGTESMITEAEANINKPMILVGGPCVNELTAKALGLAFPSCETDSGLKEGESVIKMVDYNGQKTLLVYGWEREDTMKAANKVSEFNGKDLLI